MECWERAVNLGFNDAMFDIGLFYYTGRTDVPEDPVTGNHWMHKAADAGVEIARNDEH